MSYDLDRILSPSIRQRLIDRIAKALSRAGLTSQVTIAADYPLALQSPRPLVVLGSQGSACIPSVAIVLCPESRRPAEAHSWARAMTGRLLVETVAADLLPAHVGIRLAYLVPDRRGKWFISDPPLLGIARFGRTYLENPMKKHRSKSESPNAMELEVVMDIHEIFDISLDDPRFDELSQRLQQRNRQRHSHGQVIDPKDIDRIDILERMMSKLMVQLPSRLRNCSQVPSKPTPISINRRPKQ